MSEELRSKMELHCETYSNLTEAMKELANRYGLLLDAIDTAKPAIVRPLHFEPGDLGLSTLGKGMILPSEENGNIPRVPAFNLSIFYNQSIMLEKSGE